MKFLITLIIFLNCFTNLFCQTTVKLIDSDTNKNYSSYGFEILDENNLFYSLGHKDENRFYDLKKKQLDTSKTYYYHLDQSKYERIKSKIDFNRNDTIILYAKLDPDFKYKKLNKKLVINKCPYYSFGQYRAFEPRNLDEIPDLISNKLRIHLTKILGVKFYKKLYFTGGQVIDSTAYKKYFTKSDMNVSNYYYLGFAFSYPKKGLSEYCSYIKLDESGNILNDIQLPKNYEYINNLISVELVKKKALEKEFYKEGSTKIQLEYDEKRNVLVWKFINEYYKPKGLYIKNELIYNAHNGKHIETLNFEGSWVE